MEVTTGPRKPDTLVNGELASALRKRHPRWNRESLVAESTGVLRSEQKRPDILVMEAGRWPVAVETEFEPARTVDADALARIGAHVARTGEPIEGAIAVRLPASLKTNPGANVEAARFEYAAHFLDAGGNPERHPASGWIEGGVDELADAIEHLGLSERRLAQGTQLLERIVAETAGRLAEGVPENVLADMARVLHQSPGARRPFRSRDWAMWRIEASTTWTSTGPAAGARSTYAASNPAKWLATRLCGPTTRGAKPV